MDLCAAADLFASLIVLNACRVKRDFRPRSASDYLPEAIVLSLLLTHFAVSHPLPEQETAAWQPLSNSRSWPSSRALPPCARASTRLPPQYQVSC
jgi:hypothetical protein